MNTTDNLTDEEAVAEPASREHLMKTAVLSRGRALGEMVVRPITAETLSYLFEIQNLFIRGIKGERIASQNANAIWSTAEFIYIHSADEDEVAAAIWDRAVFRRSVRAYLAGPLNDPAILTASLPIIEQMVSEYFAAQSEAQPGAAKDTVTRVGKASARRGKQAILR